MTDRPTRRVIGRGNLSGTARFITPPLRTGFAQIIPSPLRVIVGFIINNQKYIISFNNE
jgi:hypothetical protein